MSRSLGFTPKQFDERSPSKLSSHQQRLRNCKKVFDQLHRTQINTFIARKQHLENISTRTPDLTQTKGKNQGYLSFESEELRPNTKSELKQIVQIKNRRTEKNIEIIRKMLQISGINKKNGLKSFDLEGSSNLGNQIYMFEKKRHESNQSKISTRGYRGSRILGQTGDKNWHKYIGDNGGRKMSEMQVGKHSKSSEKSSQQVVHGTKNTNKVEKGTPMKKKSSLQNSINMNSESLCRTSLEASSLSLSSYIKFINAPQQIKELHIHFNFSPIRKMSSSEAWKNLDIRNGKMIENLLESILQVQFGIFRKNLQSNEINSQGIKDYCWLYFNNYEKAKLEIILKEHYFKLFAFKLNPIFVFQRIAMYFCYIICENGLISSSWYCNKMKNLIYLLKQIYTIIIKVVKQIEITKPTIKSIVNATTQNQMEETFQILRSVGEMEKYIGDIEINLNQILQNRSIEQLHDINKILRNYVKEQIFGIGKRTYENFIKTQMLLSWKYLQVPPTPFLPPIKSYYKYTIVLDLDETIIYYNQESKLLKFRPFLDTFMKKLENMKFQIIAFSASSKSYADAVIAELQRKTRIFQYRLYKDHLSLYQGRLVKDLRRLGRDITKIILIDDLNVNFSSCKDNGIQISSWHGEKDDRQLLNILGVLIKLEKLEEQERKVLKIERSSIDVRNILRENRKYLQKMLESYQANQFFQEAK